MSAGIDYGMGLANIDRETGIRFGLISQHSIMPEALAELEPIYVRACPKCGEEISDDAPTVYTRGKGGRIECPACSYWIPEDELTGDDPQGYTYTEDGYHLSSGTDGFGIFVEKSPFYTFARFCSPCAPGAGNLDSHDPDGVKTYCLGVDWFDSDSPCPYPVYNVSDDSLVQALTVAE